MGGGSATHSGVDFQDKVATLVAVHLLADAPVEFLDLPANVTPVELGLETSAPVDDVLVSTSAGGHCFLQVKRSVSLSKLPESPFGAVLDQFVRLWIACHAGGGSRSWQRPLDPTRDRLILVAGGNRSQALISALSPMLRRIRDLHAVAPREAIAGTKGEGRAYDAVMELLTASFRRHTGTAAPPEVLASILGISRVVLLDPERADRAPAMALLRQVVLANPNDAETAWTEIAAQCQRLAEGRSAGDRATFREALRSTGIRLAHVPEIARDVMSLTTFTGETLASIAHLAHLDVPTAAGKQRVEIPRKVTQALVDHAKRASLLVIGAPGSGKSGAIYSAAAQLLHEGHPVVALAVDRHPVHSLPALDRELQLERPLLAVLRDWTADRPGILFIDALDATRGGPADQVFQELIRRVIREAPSWRVVASIRVFDLRFGVTYRELFAGRPPDERYKDPDFHDIQHLHVPPLTDEELASVWSLSPSMANVYHDAPTALRQLLRSPFNLFLLASVLRAGQTDFAGVSTQVQLLHLYWSYRVIGRDQMGLQREEVLRRALQLMVDRRQLRVPLRDLQEHGAEHLHRLHSDGVLSPVETSSDRFSNVSFAHHVLFDYGIARLVLEGGHVSDFGPRLTSSDERALLVAPGATMALQMLWADDGVGRAEFWRQAFALAAAEGTGAFCRMLPARVAVALLETPGDIAPVLDCLRRPDCSDRKAALFLVQHCTGGLAAGLAPRLAGPSPLGAWPQIAATLTETALRDTGGMLKAPLSQWIAQPSLLGRDEKVSLGAACRRLLQLGLEEPYDVSMVIVGIQGIARTFETAVAESAESLRQLVLPTHAARHGHEELFWLAGEFEYLASQPPEGPGVLRDVYRAAYCTQLPSAEEETSLGGGSRILGLVSNKRQDFESARYRLRELFPRLVAVDPICATEVLIDIVSCYDRTERSSKEGTALAFRFGGRTAQYRQDESNLSRYSLDDHAHPPLRGFESGLVSLVDDGRLGELQAVVDVVVGRNELSCVWASLLKAAVRRPHALGKSLFPLLLAGPVLEGADTLKPSGDLIALLHPDLEPSDRAALEGAILTTRKAAQRALLACLSEQHIQSADARERRRAFAAAGALRPAEEPLRIEVGRPGLGDQDDWWLREQGVDLTSPVNVEVRKAVKIVEGMRRHSGDDTLGLAGLRQGWQDVQSLYRVMQEHPDLPEALRMTAWHALANVAGTAAELSRTSEDASSFADIRLIVIGALDERLWPPRVFDPEREEGFARFPSWGSPAPRVEAAGALVALVRAQGAPDDESSGLIEALARDASVAVRHQILSRTNMLYDANRPLMWRLCDIGFKEERNAGVLAFFLQAVRAVVHERPGWFTGPTLALEERTTATDLPADGRDELTPQVVALLLQLWLVYDETLAGERVRRWTADPLTYSRHVPHALFALRGALLQGSTDGSTALDEQVRARAVEVFQSVGERLSAILVLLAQRRPLEEPDRKQAETALHLVDVVAREVYFGSGAYAARHGEGGDERPAPTPEVRSRFLREMGPTLAALARVPHPSVTHHLLETLEFFIADDPLAIFRMVTDALTEGGPSGGYHLEGLGAELFGRIVRRYLAEFRGVLAESQDCQQRLMRALDKFVEVGWPDMRRLVYDLPEMLR